MKYLKQILLSITLLIVAPAFSQTAHDWQNVLKLVPVKIEENKRRIEAAKKAEEEAERERIKAEKKAKQEEETASLQQKSKENTRYVKSMDSYFVKMAGKYKKKDHCSDIKK